MKTKKLLSLTLALLLAFAISPIVPAGASSSFSEDRYIADILLNSGYYGSARSIDNGLTAYSQQLEFYKDPGNVSSSRILVRELENDGVFMGSLVAWKALTFSLSDVTESLFKEQNYYDLILFHILNGSTWEKLCNDKTVKSTLKLTSGISNAFKDFATDHFQSILFKSVQELSVAERDILISSAWADLNTMSVSSSYISDITKLYNAGTTVEQFIANCGAYASIALLSAEVKAVLLELHSACPSYEVAMKIALWNAYLACNDAFGSILLMHSNSQLTAGRFLVKTALDELWKGIFSASGLSVLLAGQYIGKAISDLCFSTDAIIEQFFTMQAMVKFEDLMSSTVTRMGNIYKSNKTDSNAKAFLVSIDLLCSTYELSCDYAVKFADIGYNQGLYNQFKALISGENQDFVEFRESINKTKSYIEKFHKEILNLEYYKEYLIIDHPAEYEAIFRVVAGFNGHKYEVFDFDVDWRYAKDYCEGLGGYLATITSREEQEFVANLIRGKDMDFYWLGGTDEVREGEWKWITGETWDFTAWRRGEPSNTYFAGYGNENYLGIWTSDLLWNDFTYSSSATSGFICEWSGSILTSPISKPSSWAEREVNAAIAAGLVPLELQRNYQDSVTRGEVASIFINLIEKASGMGIDAFMASKGVRINNGAFVDTSDKSVLAANALGIIQGIGDRRFNPGGIFTRAEIAVITNRIARVLGIETQGYAHSFIDVQYHWANHELGWPVHAGIIEGIGGNMFDPDGGLTVEMVVVLTYRALAPLTRGGGGAR